MASDANINDVLEGHVALEIECADRLILSACVPALQVPGQVARFLCGHLGHPSPSPALLGRIGNRFRAETRGFAADRELPVPRLGTPDRSRWDDRKLDHVRPHLEQACAVHNARLARAPQKLVTTSRLPATKSNYARGTVTSRRERAVVRTRDDDKRRAVGANMSAHPPSRPRTAQFIPGGTKVNVIWCDPAGTVTAWNSPSARRIAVG